MSFLYIPDEDTDSIRYTDDLTLRDGYYFWSTWFNPQTGQFFRVAEIEDDLVRVSAVHIVPVEQRSALLKEILEDEEESPLWASFIGELDKLYVDEWNVRLARCQAEQGHQSEIKPAKPESAGPHWSDGVAANFAGGHCADPIGGHCGSRDTRPDANEGWQVCNHCRYTTRTDEPFQPDQRLLRQIAQEVDAESVGLHEWECDHDAAQRLGTIVADLADLARALGWGNLADEIRKSCTSIDWKPDGDEEAMDDHL